MCIVQMLYSTLRKCPCIRLFVFYMIACMNVNIFKSLYNIHMYVSQSKLKIIIIFFFVGFSAARSSTQRNGNQMCLTQSTYTAQNTSLKKFVETDSI